MPRTYRICRQLPIIAVALLTVGAVPGQRPEARADRIEGGRGVVMEEIRNDHAPFSVRVSVDHADGRYVIGDQMKVTVRSERDGFLYLLYVDADENVSCLFPNKIQSDNAIAAGGDVVVPAAASGFRLRVAEPAGTETLKAIVTREPLQAVQRDRLTAGDITALTAEDLKGLKAETISRREWAEHDVTVTTVAAAQPPSPEPEQPESQSTQSPAPSPQQPVQEQPQQQPPATEEAPRRVGLFIGISCYSDAAVPQLHVCHLDAREMAKVMQEKCGLEAVEVLVNERATRAAVERAIRRTLPASTQPGDTVFIYWSGHGARIADDNGDEPDGFDEVLAPHDLRTTDIDSIRRTAILDDTLCRWIQDLDGRKVVLILDTCHGGGASKGVKSITHPGSVATLPAKGRLDSLESELARTKDLGQVETAVLSSAQPDQLAMERREGDLSAMTFFLVQALRDANRVVTLKDGFDAVAAEVARYAAAHGVTQNPTLLDNTTEPVLLRP